MPHRIVWNKNHTKVKIWSTIVDGYLTKFENPEELLNTAHRDLVMRDVYRICPCCEQKLQPATAEKGKE